MQSSRTTMSLLRAVRPGARSALWACVALAALGVAACCTQPGKRLMHRGISCADKQIILDTHNRMRQDVALGRVAGQPGAANMMEMVSSTTVRSEPRKSISSSYTYDVSFGIPREMPA